MLQVARTGRPLALLAPLGTATSPDGGLVLECFFGTSWFAQPGEVLDSVEASARGPVDQAAIRSTCPGGHRHVLDD